MAHESDVSAGNKPGDIVLCEPATSSPVTLLAAIRNSCESLIQATSYEQWYIKFVASRLSRLPPTLLGLAQLQTRGTGNSQSTSNVLLLGFAAVADAIRHEHEAQPAELVTILQNKHIVARDATTQSSQAQLAFILVGMLSFLYCPSSLPQPDHLELESQVAGVNAEAWVLRSFPLTNDGIHASVASLIRNFSTYRGPIPRAGVHHGMGSGGRARLSYQPLAQSLRLIKSADITLHTLKIQAGIRLLWTSSTCEHLELDINSKVLKLFRYPSFCAMLATAQPDSNLSYTAGGEREVHSSTSHLSQLFQDISMIEYDSVDRARDSLGGGYHREILLTFRIIFGQDKASLTGLGRNESLFLNSPWESFSEKDPLLIKLCGNDWRLVQVYSDIAAGPVRSSYAVDEEFPHFADRLVELQDFMQIQNPDSVRALLSDRRDMNRLWTIRIAVIIFVLTILQALWEEDSSLWE